MGNGLGELVGLKELRLLDVGNMNHDITDTEREWMHSNRPKFEELKEQCPLHGHRQHLGEDFNMEQEYENLKHERRIEEMGDVHESDKEGPSSGEEDDSKESSGPANDDDSDKEGI